MAKEKLAVTVWNYKGGVGKTTISLIFAQTASRQGLKVLAIDLDEQKNLSEALKLSRHNFPSIETRTDLIPEMLKKILTSTSSTLTRQKMILSKAQCSSRILC